MHDVDHEPSLARAAAAILRLGETLLVAGAGSYRVKDSMRRTARALGIDHHHAQVTLTEITSTVRSGTQSRTEVTECRRVHVNAERIDAVAEYVKALPVGVSIEALEEQLGRIAARPHLYGGIVNALAVGLACTAFAFLNNGGLIVCVSVFLAATAGQGLRRRLMRVRLNQLAVTLVAATFSSGMYVGAVMALEALGAATRSDEAGLISAVLYLVPGFPLVTAVLDLVRLDLSSGVTRLAYVSVILASAGTGVWVVATLAKLQLVGPTEPALGGAALVIARILASAVAAAGFAVLFNARLRAAGWAAVIAAIANTARIYLAEVGIPLQVATGAAALAVALMAAAIASRSPYSRVTLSVPAVVIMVPGVSIYRSVVGLSDGEIVAALDGGVQATIVVLAIGAGLALGRMFTDRRWAFDDD